VSIDLDAAPDLASDQLAVSLGSMPSTLLLTPEAVAAAPIEVEAPAVRVGVIGYGYWGPNLTRNLAELPGFDVQVVSDRRQQRLAQVRQRHPLIKTTTDCNEIFASPDIDAVVIVTPVSTHFDLAMEALRAGKHVLITKPIASTSAQTARLIETAAEMNRVLMVDHTFIYTGAVRRIKELINSGRLGRLYYYDSVRVNLGLFQHDVNVLWDLAVHDLAIMDYLLGQQPRTVTATGAGHVPGQPVDVAYLTCFFENNLLAHHHVNWLAPVKVRQTLIGGDRQMIVYDDLEPSEKVKVYDKGITINGDQEDIYQSMVGYRTGDMWAPQVSLAEGLHVEVEHFLDCIRRGSRPMTDGEAGLRVVRILEAATESLAQHGCPVELVAAG
jgi:predicted dehydrogenase